MKANKGFTAVELVVAIAIFIVVSAAFFVYANPIEYFKKNRDSRRLIDVNVILTAVNQNLLENKGYLLCGGATTTVPATSTQIGRGAGSFDIEPCLIPNYISGIPADPKIGTPTSTGYYIFRNPTSTAVTIIASSTEATSTISVSR